MFHPHETRCSSHMPVYRNYKTERLTSHAYMFEHNCREQVHISVLLGNIFQQGKHVRKRKKKLFAMLTLNETFNYTFYPYTKGKWTQSSYDHRER